MFRLNYIVVKHDHVHKTIQPTYFLAEGHQPSSEQVNPCFPRKNKSATEAHESR